MMTEQQGSTVMSDTQVPQSAATSSSAPLSISSANIHPFLDISPDALVIVDRNGDIVLVNGQTEAVFGYTRSELWGNRSNYSSPSAFTRPTTPTGSAISLLRALARWASG